ncbi:PTS system, fructose-specific IIA component [Ignavigranum ruoffiae]|uniref:PTS system, fructose-specific IIA component n=1 Tax=Ignavigranum ruoffiae TaxID=89093 RepID=A0A1H9B6M1_9LACT|nr:PTS sugar transporter subunit IIA [Ignavigranum ruoffiae]SEP84505.1 PTS system, fructose-specific IIA component [Ignavigranum ruoffiae]
MKTLELDKVINKNLIIINSMSKNKDEVIKELTNKLFEKNIISNKDVFINDIYKREKEGVTGIGKGIAIPHGKSKAVLKTSVAVLQLKNAIEWESLDDELIKVIIMFAVKDNDKNTVHVKLLQQVAIKLADDDFIDKLKFVDDKNKIHNLFIGKEL